MGKRQGWPPCRCSHIYKLASRLSCTVLCIMPFREYIWAASKVRPFNKAGTVLKPVNYLQWKCLLPASPIEQLRPKRHSSAAGHTWVPQKTGLWTINRWLYLPGKERAGHLVIHLSACWLWPETHIRITPAGVKASHPYSWRILWFRDVFLTKQYSLDDSTAGGEGWGENASACSIALMNNTRFK